MKIAKITGFIVFSMLCSSVLIADIEDEDHQDNFEVAPTSRAGVAHILEHYISLEDGLVKLRNTLLTSHATFDRHETIRLTGLLLQLIAKLEEMFPTIKVVNLKVNTQEIDSFLRKTDKPLKQMVWRLYEMVLATLALTRMRRHQTNTKLRAWRS
jgi:hypothetical protein